MSFTKREQKFIDFLDAVVEAELDLETTIQTNGKVLKEDFLRTRKLRKDFFKWYQNENNHRNTQL